MTNLNSIGLLLVSAGLVCASVVSAGCGDSSGAGGAGGSATVANGSTTTGSGTSTATGAGSPTLTVDNTISWCTVTVTVGTGAPTMFSGPNQSFMAPSGTVIKLHAVPNPTFMPVKWTGVTSMMGADATYTMTSAAMQTVTACCAEANGTGCT